MGFNGNGELGDGTTIDSLYPKQIVSSNVTAIATGQDHSLFLKSDGSLWAMGYNGDGELGDGTQFNSLYPEKIVSSGVTAIGAGSYASQFIKSDGSFWEMGLSGDGLGDGTFALARVNPIQIMPFVPVIIGINFSGTDVVLSATNGLGGGTYQVLMSSDLSLPISQWTPIATNLLQSAGRTTISTNVLEVTGDFTIRAPNAVDPNVSQRFFNLELIQ